MRYLIWDEKTNALETNLQKERSKGNTTRIVDWYINKLYTINKLNESIKIIDHHDNVSARHYCFNMFIQRLQVEHKHIINFLDINKENFTIKWKN